LASGDPAGGAYSAPSDPLAGGDGASHPLSRTPPHLSLKFGLNFWPCRSRQLSAPKVKFWLCHCS